MMQNKNVGNLAQKDKQSLAVSLLSNNIGSQIHKELDKQVNDEEQSQEGQIDIYLDQVIDISVERAMIDDDDSDGEDY